jgi:CHAT domain-containing protein/tetratricopeptide (TPR) repeat protein
LRSAAAAAIAALVLLPATGAVDPAERLIDDAARSMRKEAFEPARRSLDAAERLIARRGDRAAQARLERWRGVLFDAIGDGDSAARAYARSIGAARRAGDRAAEAATLRDQGFGYWRRADYARAERRAREAMAIQISLGDRAGEGASLDLLGRTALKEGRTEEAVSLLARASALRGGAGDRYGEIESRLGLLQTRLERREFDAAMDDARALGVLGVEIGDRDVEVEGLNEEAITWIVQGAADAALRCLARARDLSGDPPDAALLARVRHLEANALRSRGDHEAAIAAHEEAIGFYRLLGNHREEAWNLARKARSLAALGRNEEAESSLARALAIWEAQGDRRAAAYWTYERGRLLERIGRYDEAWRAWENALRREDEIELPYEALVLSEMGWLAARRGDAAQARTLAERAVASGERSGIPEMLWSALHRRAQIERRQGRRDEALASLERCLSVIEAMRLHVVPLDEALVGFLEDKQEVFAEAVDLLMEMGRSGDALVIGERARARAFLDLLRGRPAGESRTAPTLAALEAATRRRGVTIVEYFAGRARTFAWVLAPGAPVRAVTVACGSDRWVERIGVLRKSLAGEAAGTTADTGALLSDLERDLWEPILARLPPGSKDRVTIVPHGALFALPFASLVDPRGRYLVESVTIDYAPSIAALDAIDAGAARAEPAGGYLSIGNPALTRAGDGSSPLPALPGAEAEAAFVARTFGRQTGDLLVGAEATEAAVRSRAPARAFIHFATHGVISDDDPLESALLLAPSPGSGAASDGRLTAAEILDLPLHARLVTLAACDTGLGRVTGEGMLGLCRSFLHAGAGSVVVSLWRVSDLVGGYQMSRFYARLAKGDAPTYALRRAQLDTLEALRRGAIRTPGGKALVESPLLWAPYVLMGNGGPAVEAVARRL